VKNTGPHAPVAAGRAEQLRSLFCSPHYARLLAAARDRLEAAGDLARSLHLRGFSDGERRTLADLLGLRAVPPESSRVTLAALDAALQASAIRASLREVVEAVGGPVHDLRADRDAARTQRELVWAAARARLEAAGREDLAPWLEALRAGGSVRRAAREGQGEAELLARAVDVALRLPASGKLLSVLAAECASDPHALDPGTPLGGLALRAAAAIAGWSEVPTAAAARRELWSEVGVDCDALSAEALVLGLRPRGDGLLARHLCEAAAAGEPRRITLRELRASDLAAVPGEPVFVCENPAVVAAAADALGDRCAPVVCVEGVPSTAAMELLGRLVASGARLLVRADFDWAGLRIAGQVLAAGGSPWRFASADYLAAVESGRGGPALGGREAVAPWAPALAEAMRSRGVAVPEERVIEDLVADLRR